MNLINKIKGPSLVKILVKFFFEWKFFRSLCGTAILSGGFYPVFLSGDFCPVTFLRPLVHGDFFTVIFGVNFLSDFRWKFFPVGFSGNSIRLDLSGYFVRSFWSGYFLRENLYGDFFAVIFASNFFTVNFFGKIFWSGNFLWFGPVNCYTMVFWGLPGELFDDNSGNITRHQTGVLFTCDHSLILCQKKHCNIFCNNFF